MIISDFFMKSKICLNIIQIKVSLRSCDVSFCRTNMLILDKELDPFSWTMWHVVVQRSHCISVHLMRLVCTTAVIMRMLVWSASVSNIFVILY